MCKPAPRPKAGAWREGKKRRGRRRRRGPHTSEKGAEKNGGGTEGERRHGSDGATKRGKLQSRRLGGAGRGGAGFARGEGSSTHRASKRRMDETGRNGASSRTRSWEKPAGDGLNPHAAAGSVRIEPASRRETTNSIRTRRRKRGASGRRGATRVDPHEAAGTTRIGPTRCNSGGFARSGGNDAHRADGVQLEWIRTERWERCASGRRGATRVDSHGAVGTMRIGPTGCRSGRPPHYI